MASQRCPEWPLRPRAAGPTMAAMALEHTTHRATLAQPVWISSSGSGTSARLPTLPAAASPRMVALWADDRAAADTWRAGLAAEGLALSSLDALSASVDAQVLHFSSGLAAQLPRLRAQGLALPDVPLLVVCRGLRDLDQVLALEMGADDVIYASVSAPVVAARLRALWRRMTPEVSGISQVPRELRFGLLQLLSLERRVLLDQRAVPLTEGEFEVLWLLASRAGHAVSRREILSRVRCLEDLPMDRSIDSRVYRIRAKLGDGGSGGARRIRTVRNHGYAFSPTGW